MGEDSGAAAGPAPYDAPDRSAASDLTALSLERSRVSMNRTLMSSVRTSLSMIGFGFSVLIFFNRFADAIMPHSDAVRASAREFGLALIGLSVGTLAVGLFSHARLVMNLRRRRRDLAELGLVRLGPQIEASPIAVMAILLLLAGVLTVLSIALHLGPFD
jgi:putative membrane protein